MSRKEWFLLQRYPLTAAFIVPLIKTGTRYKVKSTRYRGQNTGDKLFADILIVEESVDENLE